MLEPTSSALFYANLTAFDDFTSVAEVENYTPAPDDWFVVIADIQGSTPAIEAGRYKDVNMIGAACINAVLNVCTQDEIPYSFCRWQSWWVYQRCEGTQGELSMNGDFVT